MGKILYLKLGGLAVAATDINPEQLELFAVEEQVRPREVCVALEVKL